MKKKEVSKRVLKNGKPLSIEKFEWDEQENKFFSLEECLVVDFMGVDDCTFYTGSNCTFYTGSNCNFDTGYGCTFKTGPNCAFTTRSGCTFDVIRLCYINNNAKRNVVIIRDFMKKTVYDLDNEPNKLLLLTIDDVVIKD